MKKSFTILAAPMALMLALAVAPGTQARGDTPQTANPAARAHSYILAENDTGSELAQDNQGVDSGQQTQEAVTPDEPQGNSQDNNSDNSNQGAGQDNNPGTEDANQPGAEPGDAGEAQSGIDAESATPEVNQ